MADRIPLILNTNANQIQEIASGDTLDLTGNNVNGVGILTCGSLSSRITGNVDIQAGILTTTGNIDANGIIEGIAGQNKIPSLYNAMTDLPNAGSYHGMFAHVHATQRGYFAHGGGWYELVNKEASGVVGTGTESFNVGVVTAGTLNATTFGAISGSTASFSGNVSVGGVLTYEDVLNVDSVGIVTARSGVVTPNVDVDDFISVGSNIHLGNAGIITASSYRGDGSQLTGISVGITTEALVKTNGQTATLDLSKADHKVTATGTVTIDTTGGTESDSHTLRIVNNGTATINFSNKFLFPSGGTPNLPTTSGAISLISFTVHQTTGSVKLLAGASVNFS